MPRRYSQAPAFFLSSAASVISSAALWLKRAGDPFENRRRSFWHDACQLLYTVMYDKIHDNGVRVKDKFLSKKH